MIAAVSGEVLAAALEYAAAWRGKTVVVKVGGSVLQEQAPDPGTVARDIALLHGAGLRMVVVHGGGRELTGMLERLGMEAHFVNGLRVSDAATVEVAEMVLSGRVNKRLVTRLEAAGAPAVGLSGRDGGVLQVAPHPDSRHLGFVGEARQVNCAPLLALSKAGFVPVISPIGAGDGGVAYNVNADAAASALASALQAQKLILLTDVAGILKETANGPELYSELDAEAAHRLLSEGVIGRGMIPKVRACLKAIARGVPSTHIVDAESPHSLLLELFTEEGVGTMIRSGTMAFPRRAALGGERYTVS